jgi:hypothetical protein
MIGQHGALKAKNSVKWSVLTGSDSGKSPIGCRVLELHNVAIEVTSSRLYCRYLRW